MSLALLQRELTSSQIGVSPRPFPDPIELGHQVVVLLLQPVELGVGLALGFSHRGPLGNHDQGRVRSARTSRTPYPTPEPAPKPPL